ncbi:hypothetical protein A5893_11815 [Pedobacter psychrophilus]|uniref:DUF6249 domain-containing protein n=1 Tax=Pedobacter psychrophilus TaxID=1826909 RepID=A0A179DDF0_9SPHI|nr:DUF6249 domain-containing protein [Pedobacter psychrophilus]OAQ38730.1 hypothetical protein A5893_11815 [Pedobacter psychrophilus]
MNGPEILIPITFFICTFAAIFGLRYMANKERMAMIEKGIDIGSIKAQPQPYKNLKWGLLLIGAGLGLFLAFVLDQTVFKIASGVNLDKNVPIYFALIAIFGGLGLFISYLIEKKETL